MRGQRDERRTPYQSREHAGVGGRQLRITVTTIMGQATPLDVQSTSTIGDVKVMIKEKDGVPVARQRLVFNDTPQEDGVTLGGIGVQDGATIHLIMVELGSGPEPEPEPKPEPLVPNVPGAEATAEEP